MRSPRVGPWGPNVRVGGAVARASAGVTVKPVLCGVWAGFKGSSQHVLTGVRVAVR